MKKVFSYLVVLFVGVALGAVFFGPIGVTPEEINVPTTLSCGDPQVIEVPVEVVVTAIPSATERDVYCESVDEAGVSPLYKVDAESVNRLVDTVLAVNPAFTDPRVSCNGISEGFQLGDTGLCIPKNPPAGLCIEGSSDFPCDMRLVGVQLPFASDGGYSVPGDTRDFMLELMLTEVYQRDFTLELSAPIELDAVVIPVSSALSPVLGGELGVIMIESFKLELQTP